MDIIHFICPSTPSNGRLTCCQLVAVGIHIHFFLSPCLYLLGRFASRIAGLDSEYMFTSF